MVATVDAPAASAGVGAAAIGAADVVFTMAVLIVCLVGCWDLWGNRMEYVFVFVSVCAVMVMRL
jgi:hypothetical protein